MYSKFGEKIETFRKKTLRLTQAAFALKCCHLPPAVYSSMMQQETMHSYHYRHKGPNVHVNLFKIIEGVTQRCLPPLVSSRPEADALVDLWNQNRNTCLEDWQNQWLRKQLDSLFSGEEYLELRIAKPLKEVLQERRMKLSLTLPRQPPEYIIVEAEIRFVIVYQHEGFITYAVQGDLSN